MHSSPASTERDRTRRFRAATVEEAVEAAVRELGPDARILEANRIRRGGVGGFFTTDLGVEVMAAGPGDPSTEPAAASMPSLDPGSLAPGAAVAAVDRPAGGVTPLAAGRRGGFVAADGADDGLAGSPLESLVAAAGRSESRSSVTPPAASFATHLAGAAEVVDDAVVAEALAAHAALRSGTATATITPATATAATTSVDDVEPAAGRLRRRGRRDHPPSDDLADATALPRATGSQRRAAGASQHGPESASIVDVVAEALAARRAEAAHGGTVASTPAVVPATTSAPSAGDRRVDPVGRRSDAGDAGDVGTTPDATVDRRRAVRSDTTVTASSVTDPSGGGLTSPATRGRVSPDMTPPAEPRPAAGGDRIDPVSDRLDDVDVADGTTAAATSAAVRAAAGTARTAATKRAAADRAVAKRQAAAERTAPATEQRATRKPATKQSATKQAATKPATKQSAAKRSGASRSAAARTQTPPATLPEVDVAADAIGRLLERVAVLDVPAGTRVDDVQTLQVAVTSGDGTRIEMSAVLGGNR